MQLLYSKHDISKGTTLKKVYLPPTDPPKNTYLCPLPPMMHLLNEENNEAIGNRLTKVLIRPFGTTIFYPYKGAGQPAHNNFVPQSTLLHEELP